MLIWISEGIECSTGDGPSESEKKGYTPVIQTAANDPGIDHAEFIHHVSYSIASVMEGTLSGSA